MGILASTMLQRSCSQPPDQPAAQHRLLSWDMHPLNGCARLGRRQHPTETSMPEMSLKSTSCDGS
eukprot:6912701-Pyramimonas_sp.AAC.1